MNKWRNRYLATPFQIDQYWKILRQQAERQLKLGQGASGSADQALLSMKLQKMHHELSVQKIELEMQNEDLCRTQEQLRSTSELYCHLYEQAPVGYISMDATGVIIHSNLTASSLLAVSPQTLLGQPFTRFIFEDDQDIFYFLRRRLFDGDTSCSSVLRMRREGADPFWAMLEAKVTQKHFAPGVVLLVLNDINERTVAATKLRTSEERFRGAFENSSVGMIMADMHGTWIKVNQALCEMLGYSEPQLLTMGYLGLTHPDDLTASIEHAQRLYRGELSHYRIEKRYLHRDGHAVWTVLSATLLRDASGLAQQYVGMVEDISIRKLALRALELSHEKLRKLVAHQEHTKEQERIRIAREMHDELGSVLSGIKAQISVALFQDQQNGGALQSRLTDACTLLDTAADTVRKVITELRPSVLDQLGVWAALEWHAAEVASRAGLVCQVCIDTETALLDIDPERSTALFRILQEALTNVLRHANATQVNIRIHHEQGAITLEIEDDGKGIDMDILSTSSSWGLTGMAERARHFGGDIRFIPLEHGTLVMLRLPLQVDI